ncbi:MAG: leucine-rich repeat domain-containing protein [Bacteroidota bacterium]|nr:leucine-rich repeat domain-containing protein [Bacteroidota bacterium]
MKKTIIPILVLSSVLTITSCGGGKKDGETSSNSTEQSSSEPLPTDMLPNEQLWKEKEYTSIEEALKVPAEQVYRLNLSNKNLTALPLEVLKFTKLQYLNLYGNIGITDLPKEIGSLKRLQWLMLSAGMTKIPEGVFELGNLQELDCGYIKQGKVDDKIANLKNLKRLYLGNNDLNEFPMVVLQLTNLEHLHLHYNKKIPSIPSEINKLTHLKELFVQGNQLTTLPATIGDLKELYDLEAQENQITSVPKEIGNCTKLYRLFLDKNKLTEIPDMFATLSELRGVRFENNDLKQLPSSMANLSGISGSFGGNANLDLKQACEVIAQMKGKNLRISFYQQKGMNGDLTLPAEISKCTNISDLDLRGNKINFQAEIEKLSKMTSLETLSVKDCGFTSLPSNLNKLKNLKQISLTEEISKKEEAKLKKDLPNTKVVNY